MARFKVLLADDHAILLDAFRKLLEPSFDIVGTVTDGQALVQAAETLRPDVIVADISMPHLNGLDACERIKQRVPRARLVFLTMDHDPDTAAEAFRRGASGYVLKASAAAELFAAIEAALEGRTYVAAAVSEEPAGVFVSRAGRGSKGVLSLRQREVLQLLAEGRSMKEAAEVLQVTPRTIAFHKYTIMQQLGLKTTAELVRYALAHGLLRGPDLT